ncbi:hypothetical protein FSP39_004928 [Pinctada imbricata]|uniref:DNA-directed DNA polymerase n=1 Tax=Pinctada imbricata TaxID=66713 RepID=A0AA88YGT0_PINIB|nr:hypothetical protein FSP39_004928 [Pinctada imbricata]
MKPDKIIYSGSKIMYMYIGNKLNLRFLDSLNFLPGQLSKLPQLFELEELCKGFFPHKFNTKGNQNYSGRFPPPEDYGYETMSSARRKDFLLWYREKESETFHFQTEMLKYCRSDVDILRRACLKFRKLMLEVTHGIDPFDYVTIASVCMGIFKTLFLKEEHEREIINLRNNKSLWYPVTHINQKENILVDGSLIPAEELSNDEHLKLGGIRFGKSPIAVVPSNGYHTNTNFSKSSIQWLEWLMEKAKHKGSPIQIQHALNQGEFKVQGTNYRCDGYDRTNNTIYEYYGCAVHGCPVCFPNDRSFLTYPATKQSLEELYPLHHPKIITDGFSDISSYFGIAKIKVLPPRKLYHPVLPYTSNGKLKFPLCRTCADKESQTECGCDDEERSLIGTWCTPEIDLAIKKGYTIMKIYEVYHFDDSTLYDPIAKKGGLFTEYVNMFLKIKQEASGFPAECESEEEKLEYIRQYRLKEGIDLEYHKIKANKGLRNLGKICLNSFWGKFGQRIRLKQSKFIHESEAENLFKTLTDPRKEIYDFHIVAKDILQLEYYDDPLFLPNDIKTNIFLASFTTMWARLRLYEILDVLDRDVLYYDTDSVIFRCDDFGFNIVNFPWLDGDVPRLPSYGIYISQLIRYARACTDVLDFHNRNLQITKKLLGQGFRFHKLVKTFWKFYKNYDQLLLKFGPIQATEYITLGISQPAFYGDLINKIRRIKGRQHMYRKCVRVIKRLLYRGYDPNVTRRTLSLVLDQYTVLYERILKTCTLTDCDDGTP